MSKLLTSCTLYKAQSKKKPTIFVQITGLPITTITTLKCSHLSQEFPPGPTRQTWSAEHDVVVHAVDADVGIVLDAKVDVLLDAEPKVARRAEVALAQLVLTNLQPQTCDDEKQIVVDS